MSFDKRKYFLPGTLFKIEEGTMMYNSNSNFLERIRVWDGIKPDIYALQMVIFETIPYLSKEYRNGIYLNGAYVLFKIDDVIYAADRDGCIVLPVKG